VRPRGSEMSRFQTNRSRINWRASLVPAATVIPAPIAHTNIAAVKTLVVERCQRYGIPERSAHVFGGRAIVGSRLLLRGHTGNTNPGLRLRGVGSAVRLASAVVRNPVEVPPVSEVSDVVYHGGRSRPRRSVGWAWVPPGNYVTRRRLLPLRHPRRETAEQRQPLGPELSPSLAPSRSQWIHCRPLGSHPPQDLGARVRTRRMLCPSDR